MMPLYDFRCPKCGLEFEVSRPMNRSDEPAFCLMDGTECERVLSMPVTFVKSDPTLPAPPANEQSTGWSHFGHTHGPGAGAHSHGFPTG
jgi:putative FmdB family regulatory protein